MTKNSIVILKDIHIKKVMTNKTRLIEKVVLKRILLAYWQYNVQRHIEHAASESESSTEQGKGTGNLEQMN